MTINLTRMSALIMFLAICGASVSGVMGQTSASKTQPPRVIKYDGDMAYMLAQLTEIFGVTIGLEVDPRQPKSQVSFYLRDPTLPDVLNAIVKSAPTYQWREQSGCIEVLPVGESSPLLDTMISNFRVSEVDQTEAVNCLMNLPEVQANLRAMSLNRRDPGSASTETKGERFSMNLEGMPMRQALSKIANEGADDSGSFELLVRASSRSVTRQGSRAEHIVAGERGIACFSASFVRRGLRAIARAT